MLLQRTSAFGYVLLSLFPARIRTLRRDLFVSLNCFFV